MNPECVRHLKKVPIAVLWLLLLLGCSTRAPQSAVPELPASNLNVLIANDMGRRGISEQHTIAGLLGKTAEQNTIAFLAIPGDPIHDDGVQSVDDTEWQLKIEQVYTAPSLSAIPWYVVPGNHEYRGNVQALLDYSQKSKRWNAPARYFSFTQPIGDSGKECLFVFIDTTPLIDKYRTDTKKYSAVKQQDFDAQLAWIQHTLASSNARWKIVFGHHPVFADTEKDDTERADMQKRLAPLLENNNVDFYICGHIHNFQHIKPVGMKTDYIVNSSASLSRKVHPVEGTVFCNPDPGFSVLSISADTVDLYMENQRGKVVYQYSRK